MPKFSFRLEPLRKFREQRLLAARREMMTVQGALVDAADARRKAFADRAALLEIDDLSERARSAALVQSVTLHIAQLHQKIRELEEDFERHRRWVAHLGTELKAIEKLEERQRTQFEDGERLKEKRQADRWVAENWSRGRVAAGDAE